MEQMRQNLAFVDSSSIRVHMCHSVTSQVVTHSSSAGVLETEALLVMVHADKFDSHIQKDEAQRR